MNKVRILVFFLVIVLGVGFNSCATVGKMFNKNYASEKVMKEQEKESKHSDKDYKKLKKAQFNRQPKETQEMIKKSKKKARKKNRYKTERWWKKVLGL
jgi:hypothetical protein